jgi:hypothetical protein
MRYEVRVGGRDSYRVPRFLIPAPAGDRTAPSIMACMPIILPNGLTPQEIRVLQEYRLRNTDTLSADAIKTIKHPAGGGEAPALSLAGKGFVAASDGGFAITQKGKDFLAIDARPMIEETSDAAASAAGNPDADGV